MFSWGVVAAGSVFSAAEVGLTGETLPALPFTLCKLHAHALGSGCGALLAPVGVELWRFQAVCVVGWVVTWDGQHPLVYLPLGTLCGRGLGWRPPHRGPHARLSCGEGCFSIACLVCVLLFGHTRACVAFNLHSFHTEAEVVMPLLQCVARCGIGLRCSAAYPLCPTLCMNDWWLWLCLWCL